MFFVAEGLRDVLLPENTDVVFDENNGALVMVRGQLNIQDSLKDDKYGISMPSVKMRKVVQVSIRVALKKKICQKYHYLSNGGLG